MSHEVTLSQHAVRFTVEDDETILAAGLRQGLALPFGCKTGGCASCRVRCVAGEVAYDAPPQALSAAELAAGYVLMCLARPRTDLTLDLHQPRELEALKPRILPCRVIERHLLNHDVIGMQLRLPQGETFRWLPGQYIDFLLAEGRRRSFSIANAFVPDRHLELHLRVTPGGRFTHWVMHEMPEKAVLRFEGPLGAFYLREDSARPVLLMAGGTGFAPIKAILEDQLPRNAARPFHLFWGARARRDLYLHELAESWAARHPNFRYTPVLSEPDADWRGARGLVHEALLAQHSGLAGHELYISGPPAMVQAAKKHFAAAGLDPDHLYYDSFDYAFETWPALG